MKFGIRKLEYGLPDGEEITTLAFFVFTPYQRVTDGRTDRHVAVAKTRASIASRGYYSSIFGVEYLEPSTREYSGIRGSPSRDNNCEFTLSILCFSSDVIKMCNDVC